jgi:hypothetical protein
MEPKAAARCSQNEWDWTSHQVSVMTSQVGIQ